MQLFRNLHKAQKFASVQVRDVLLTNPRKWGIVSLYQQLRRKQGGLDGK